VFSLFKRLNVGLAALIYKSVITSNLCYNGYEVALHLFGN
jgi:hypothetical protein